MAVGHLREAAQRGRASPCTFAGREGFRAGGCRGRDHGGLLVGCGGAGQAGAAHQRHVPGRAWLRGRNLALRDAPEEHRRTVRLVCRDIGPETRDLFVKKIEGARTVFWNGPMGAYEKNLFSDVLRRTIVVSFARTSGV